MGANSVQDWKQGLSHPPQLLPCNLAPGVPGHLVLMLPWSVVWTAAFAVLASLHRGCACLRYATVGMVPPPVSLRFRCAWGEVKWVEVMPVALASAGSLGPVLVYLLGAPRAPHADPGPGWVLSSYHPAAVLMPGKWSWRRTAPGRAGTSWAQSSPRYRSTPREQSSATPSQFHNRHEKLKCSWAVDLDATG